jgi:glycerol transport system ATP-binding protein
MNFVDVEKRGERVQQIHTSRPIGIDFTGLEDGSYRVGFRANHLALSAPDSSAIPFECECVGTEITGSESYVHLMHEGQSWVALQHGVHDIPAGEHINAYLDPVHAYIFAADDTLVAAAPYAEAA